MTESNEARIIELKKTISTLKWDINLLRNKAIKKQLNLYQKELDILINNLEIELNITR